VSRLSSSISGHFRTIFDTDASGRLMLYSPLVGIVAGLGGVVFYLLLQLMQKHVLGGIMGYYPPVAGGHVQEHAVQFPTQWWLVLIIPALGGLVCGYLVYTFAPEAEGHGTDAMVKAFHRLGGKIRTRIPFVKSIASICTIGTGGSAGQEGPIAQIGAGFGSFLADQLKLGERDRRLLMLSGAAGGIGAIFGAPLGGALFVCEVLYATTALEFAAVIPCFISSIVAYTTFSMILGAERVLITLPSLKFVDFRELPLYLVLAVLCSLVGFIYVRVFYGLRAVLFRPLPIPKVLKPAVGGLLIGMFALVLPQVMAGGYGWIQKAIDKELAISVMVILCFGKILATSLTISSGGSGGVFAPSLFIGAMLGGAYGKTCQHFMPDLVDQPEAFVLVGMGGFFAGVAKVPITAMIMVSEMSESYGLLVPLMLVSIVNVAILSSKCSLYEEQVPTLVDSPAHQGDFVIDVLEQMHVGEVMDRTREYDWIPQEMPLPQVLRIAANSENLYFPVIDQTRALIGIFSLRDLRAVLTGEGAGGLVLAIDICTSPVLTVSPEDDLHAALRKLTQKNIEELPVVAADNAAQVLGVIGRKDVISAYHRRLNQLREGTK